MDGGETRGLSVTGAGLTVAVPPDQRLSDADTGHRTASACLKKQRHTGADTGATQPIRPRS